MNHKYIFIVSLFIVGSLNINTSYSQTGALGREDICEMTDPSAQILKVDVDDTPNYFFRAFSKSPLVSYASNSTNYILNLETGKKLPMPGEYDPVPLWDERAITIPEHGMAFYALEDLLEKKQGVHAKPLIEDPTLRGTYQSVGTLQEGKIFNTYRVVSTRENGNYRDYHAGNLLGEYKVIPLGETKRNICSDYNLSLPMLSKNGRELAALDQNTQTTKIFDISKEGECTEILDLGFSTGKVDFSFDNKKLTFHIANSGGGDGAFGGFFRTPNASQSMNVYVYDRETQAIQKITSNNSGKNSYYPVFKEDGNIVYMHVDQDRGSSFIVADPSKTGDFDFSQITRASEDCPPADKKEFSAIASIGELWSLICLQHTNANATAASFIALSLDPQKCKSLVKNYWTRSKETIAQSGQLTSGARAVSQQTLLELTEKDLLAACPKDKTIASKKLHFEKLGPPASLSEKHTPAVKLLQKKCLMCHPGFHFNDLSILTKQKTQHPQSKKDSPLGKEIIARIKGTSEGRPMPLGDTLSPEEVEAIEDYLEAD